jgi:hypothetical protein
MGNVIHIHKNLKRITGPLFKWFGSKWSAAPKYPIPIHSTIFEPYAGSAGYSLRYSHLNIQLFDTNLNLKLLWSWLIDKAEHKDIVAIPLELKEGTDIRSLDLSLGQQLLLKHWQRTNNYGECWTISPWGNKPGQWTSSTRERVAREVEFIKHWKFEPIGFIDQGTYFIDPPYEYNYRYGANDFDFSSMANRIKSIPLPNQVIVCEAICPETNRIPDYLDFEFFAKRVTSRRRLGNNVYSKELMYHRINGK